MGDILVLKNGAHITTAGAFSVHGNFVRYHDADDQLLQIPLKLVDLDASKQATLAAKEADANQKPKIEKKVEKKKTIAEIATDLDQRRGQNYEPPSNVSLDTKSVKKYRQDGENDVHSDSLAAPDKSASDIMANRGRIGEEYNRIADEIKALDDRIKSAEATIVTLRNEMNFGDDPTGAAYKNLQTFEAQRTKLLQERADKFKKLNQVKQQARQAGDNSVARKRPVKKYNSDHDKEDDLKYRSEDDEFDYQDDSDQ